MFDNSSDEDTLLNRLIEVSTFGLDDLELNREGKMSGLQRSRLALLAIFYSIACTLIFAFAIVTIWLLFTQRQSISILVMSVWIIFLTFSSSYWLHQALPMWQDVRTGTVLCISGSMKQTYTRSGGRAPMYALHYKIAKKLFDIALFAPQLIPQEQKCHAYYTPRSGILVGIEPV